MILGLMTLAVLATDPDSEQLYQAELPSIPAAHVNVVHSGGDCTVLPLSAGAVARAELRVTVSGTSSTEERDYLQKIRLAVEPQAQGLTVRPAFPAPESKPPSLSLAAHLTLWLPASTSLDVDSRYGTVDVRGLNGPVTVQNRLGPVRCRDLGAALTIRNEYDEVEVQDVVGPVVVQNSEQVTVRGVRHGVRVTNKFGPVRIVGAGGPVYAENRNAPIEVARAPAGVEVVAPYCRVSLDEVGGPVKVSGNNEDLMAQTVKGDLTIDHRHGELSLSDITGRLIVRGQFIPMAVRRVRGDVEIRTTASSVFLERVEGSALVEGETGAMELRDVRGRLQARGQAGLLLVALPVAPVTADGPAYDLSNRGSPIELEIPAELSATLRVQSTLGVIESEFPSLTTEQSGRVRSGTLVLGAGEMTIEALCIDGAVRIRRAVEH